MRPHRRTRLVVLLLAATLGVMGCSGSPSQARRSKASLVAPSVVPKAGGTLRVATDAALTWADASGVPTTAAASLARLTGRQLESLDGVDSLGDRADPKPDLTPFADFSDDKLSIAFRLRSVRYAPPYAGTLVAADVVFGLELLCDPAHPDGDSALLGAAIVGYARFCAGMMALPDGEAGVRDYADNHPIAGLSVSMAGLVTMRLIRPQGNLLDILTLPDMAPFPEAAFSPATGVTSWITAPSLGPYVRSALGSGFTFTRNPLWDATQDPLRRAWADSVTVTVAGSLTSARAAVAAGSADVLLDDTVDPGEQAALPTVPTVPTAGASAGGSSAGGVRAGGVQAGGVLRSTPAGDVLALLPLRSSAGACAAALSSQGVRQALAIGLDHRPVVTALGGSALADARAWPLPSGFVGGTGAPPVAGRDGAEGPGSVPVATAAIGATPALGGDPGRARALLAAAGVGSLTCSLTAIDPASGAPDPLLYDLLPSVAAGLAAMGVTVHLQRSGPADLTVERLTSQWRGDGAGNLLAPLIAATTNEDVQAAVLRAEGQSDQDLAAAAWAAVAALLTQDGDVVPIAEQRVQSLTASTLAGYRWYGLADGIDLANAALGLG